MNPRACIGGVQSQYRPSLPRSSFPLAEQRGPIRSLFPARGYKTPRQRICCRQTGGRRAELFPHSCTERCKRSLQLYSANGLFAIGRVSGPVQPPPLLHGTLQALPATLQRQRTFCRQKSGRMCHSATPAQDVASAPMQLHSTNGLSAASRETGSYPATPARDVASAPMQPHGTNGLSPPAERRTATPSLLHRAQQTPHAALRH